jgi:hypothetical protein
MQNKYPLSVVLIVFSFLLSVAAVSVQAQQESVWQRIDRSQLEQPGFNSQALPNAYEAFRLNRTALESTLRQAPEESASGSRVVLSMPMPDGIS